MAKTAAEILAEAEDPSHGRVETAFVLQRQDLQARYEQLQGEARASARRRGDMLSNPELADIKRQIEEVEAEIADALIEYRFRNTGHRAWADLLAKHPPTKVQLAANRFADHNPDTFKPAALAAACVTPADTTPEFFQRLSEIYSPDQFEAVWLACWTAHMGVSGVPKAVMAMLGRTPPANGPSESSASETDEASPEASSSDE